MKKCTVTLSANAGVSLEIGGHRILIDALHNKKIHGFSAVTDKLWTAMLQNPHFEKPEFLCFTHCHDDHYSRELTARAREIWPDAQPILPSRDFADQLLLSKKAHHITSGKLNLFFRRLPHEGGDSIPHYGILLEYENFHIFLPGDCEIADPGLLDLLPGADIDLALLNFTWAARRAGRRYLEEILRPRHLILYHLPFEEDEAHHFRAATERCVSRLSCPDVRILSRALQCVGIPGQ